MNKNILLLLLISITAQAQHHATQSRSRKNEIPGNLTSHVADGFKKKYTNICQNDRLGDVEKKRTNPMLTRVIGIIRPIKGRS